MRSAAFLYNIGLVATSKKTKGTKKAPPRKATAKKAPPKKAKKKAKPDRRQKPLWADVGTPVAETRHFAVQGSKVTEVKPRGIRRGTWSSQYVTMQLQWVDCGRCDKAHGPYWYAYKRGKSGGRGPGQLVCVYVGKERNEAKAMRLLRARGVL